MIRLFALAALLIAAPLAAQGTANPFTISGRGYPTLQAAVDAIGAGNAVISIAPGTHRVCAVQQAGTIAYRAAEAGKAIFDGTACEGKAALVLRGAGARVEGLVFRNLRVPDRNGAGIRLERGDLLVIDSQFQDSEQGILTADDPAGTIRIVRSTFTGLGGCPGGQCSHSIYVGDYGALIVDRARFEAGTGGHYVKARARRVMISASSFDDVGGRGTNYMIDLPDGATGSIARNVFVQGADKENYSAFVAVAAERRRNSSAGLAITGNEARLAPDLVRQTFFVADWSGARLAIGANRLSAGIAPYERR